MVRSVEETKTLTRADMFIESANAYRKRAVLIREIIAKIQEKPEMKEQHPEIFQLAEEIGETLKF